MQRLYFMLHFATPLISAFCFFQSKIPIAHLVPLTPLIPLTSPHDSATQGRSALRTNHSNMGLISADRNNKATLLLTIPCFQFKSSAKDLSTSRFG